MFGKSVLQDMSAYKQGMQTDEVKEKYQLDKIVKLASNENPYGYSDQVAKLFRSMDFDFEIYPDGYAYDLRKKVAEIFDVQLDEIVFGGGSDEIVAMICRAFLHEGTNTVMATPTFPQYRHSALIEGASLKEIPTVNGRHNLEAMAAAIDEQTKVVWICNPDNPTGEFIDANEIEQFMDNCPQHVLVVLDEAYYEFVGASHREHVKKYLDKYKNLVILRTFSKIYGLASLRVGYGIANENIANIINVVRGPFNVTTLGQKAALVALGDEKFIADTQAKNATVRQAFCAFLDDINWGYNESYANFVLVHTPVDADAFSLYLLERGFIVRSGNLLGYPNTVRITLGNETDMQELQAVIQTFQDELSNEVK